MTDLIVATMPAPPSDLLRTAPARPRDVFLPSDIRRHSVFGTLRRRLRWPLGTLIA